VDISWQVSTWSELFGAVALVLGLGTRFFRVSLVILAEVASASVHAGPDLFDHVPAVYTERAGQGQLGPLALAETKKII
jgi:uncharacterized membrane protein YphA (DoxX/SURF4 family)